MTTQNTKLMLFAIAATSLMGMSFSPAFADDQLTINYVNDTPEGQTATSPVDNDDCGDPFTTCGTYTTVYNNSPSEKVEVNYKVVTATCDVHIDWYKNNVKQGATKIFTDVSTGPGNYLSVSKFFSISSTDDIRTETNFVGCTWP